MNPYRYSGPFWLALLPGVLLATAYVAPARGDELTRQVQEELRKRHIYFGDVDGRYTSQIAAAVRRYQERKGFATSGEIDDTTLRSLSLAPVSTQAVPAATAAAAANPPPPGPAVAWPDLPVLLSDQGREEPPPAGTVLEITDPTPMPTPKPPPAAATQLWPGEEAVRGFVADYLRTGESNAPGAQKDFYASKVNYFNEGLVGPAFIAKDTARYNKRWPERHFALVDPVEVGVPSDGQPGEVSVRFHCHFTVRQPGNAAKSEPEKTVTGETTNTYLLARTGPDSLRIVSIQEERVRGQ